MVATSGNWSSRVATIRSNCSRTARASGWAKIVWMAAITMWVLFRFTRVSTLRMKWTRHRCQAEPTITASTAAFRPRCWSEMTRRTPAESPGPQGAQELGPKGPVLGVADGTAEHLPVAVHGHPGGHHHGPGDHLVVDPALQVGGVQEHVGELDVVEASGTGTPPARSSSSAQIRLTSDLEIPDSSPRATTRSSTFLVETPWT